MRINNSDYRRTQKILVVALCLLPTALEAAKKSEKWVQGTLIDYDSGLGIGFGMVVDLTFRIRFDDGNVRVYAYQRPAGVMAQILFGRDPRPIINAPIMVRVEPKARTFDVIIQDQSEPRRQFKSFLTLTIAPESPAPPKREDSEQHAATTDSVVSQVRIDGGGIRQQQRPVAEGAEPGRALDRILSDAVAEGVRRATESALLGRGSYIPNNVLQGEKDGEGALERVTESGLSIRLPDGRIVEAAFGAYSDAMQIASLKERFIGDIVHIRCRPIPQLYDKAEDLGRFLGLTEVRFVRAPTAGELSSALASRRRLQKGNLLKVAGTDPDLGLSLNSLHLPQTPGLSSGDEFLEKSRTAISAYLAKVPNYVADETAERSQTTDIKPDWNWRKIDSVKSEVRFDGNLETRENIFLNGSPWTQPFVMLPGSKWRGGFGGKLRALFDPERPVRFTFSQSIVYRGKRARVYEFSAPRDALGYWHSGYQTFFPAFEGKVTITEDDLMVVRLESKAREFPPAFPISSAEDATTWEWVAAGDGRELLPVSGEVLVVYANEQRAYFTQVDYRNHRHFQASSNLTFDK